MNHLELLKKHYIDELMTVSSEQKKHNPQSPESQEKLRVMKRIVQDMQSKIGTPEESAVREQRWRERLSEIDERLKSFQTSRFKPLSSPENSQV